MKISYRFENLNITIALFKLIYYRSAETFHHFLLG